MYTAVATRLDIAKAVNKLSQFLLNPSQQHLDAVDHILSYLDTHRALAIEFLDLSATPEIAVFLCSSDAAFADNADWKSSYGFLFKLFGGPIDWKVMKQKMVMTSSIEAELLALSNIAKEVLWWQ